MELCAMEQKSLLIIADNVDGEALLALLVNNSRGTLKSCVVKTPNFGDKKLAELQDIATVTGGTVISSQLDMKLNKVTKDQLGRCESVSITSKDCTIVGGKGENAAIEERIKELENRLNEDASLNEYQQRELKDRLGKLNGGVAILYVGALSEMELNEKKDRVDDALCACRATFENGYLPGGGISYINAAMYLADVCNTKYNNDPDRLAGYKLLIEALKTPLTQIVNNGFGDEQGAYVVSKVINDKSEDDTKFNYGFDARKVAYCDMIESGIIDPTKVAIASIKYASAIGGIYLTTGCIVIDENEKEETK
jgi:chaperonin GroEL